MRRIVMTCNNHDCEYYDFPHVFIERKPPVIACEACGQLMWHVGIPEDYEVYAHTPITPPYREAI